MSPAGRAFAEFKSAMVHIEQKKHGDALSHLQRALTYGPGDIALLSSCVGTIAGVSTGGCRRFDPQFQAAQAVLDRLDKIMKGEDPDASESGMVRVFTLELLLCGCDRKRCGVCVVCRPMTAIKMSNPNTLLVLKDVHSLPQDDAVDAVDDDDKAHSDTASFCVGLQGWWIAFFVHGGLEQ